MIRNVVVTGCGALAPGAANALELWQRALEAKSLEQPIPESWQAFFSPRSEVWTPLSQAEHNILQEVLSPVERRQLDLSQQLAIAATHEALQSAGVDAELIDEKKNLYVLSKLDPIRSGVFVGTGIGGAVSLMQNHAAHLSSGFDSQGPLAGTSGRFNPFSVAMGMPNAIAGNLGIRFGLTGANQTSAGACAAGTIAIANAFEAISTGWIDFAIVCGSEYLGDPHGGIFRAFDAARVLGSSDKNPVNRPFTQGRSGFVFSEGASGVLILESAEHATRRGASALAEIVSVAQSFDAYNIMAPAPDGRGVHEMYSRLLDAAHIQAEEVDHINTHGTATLEGDATEAAVVRSVFPHGPSLTASKGIFGHSIGASGAIEAIITLFALRHQTAPPLGCTEDLIEQLNVCDTPRLLTMSHAVSNSFAFGGQNAAILFRCIDD